MKEIIINTELPKKWEGFKEGDGILLLVNKPLTWTSFDVVKKIRVNIPRRTKIGHGGTLDPLATGLILIGIGRMTKQFSKFQLLDKTYEGSLTLGGTTPTFDAEMEIDQEYPTDHITETMIHEHTKNFLGGQTQETPIYSAARVNGKRLYEYARNGETAEVKKRWVEIHQFDITKIEMPRVEFLVDCGKGTYIRALANDFGKALDSGAYLSALHRTRVGQFHIKDAWELDELIEIIQKLKSEASS